MLIIDAPPSPCPVIRGNDKKDHEGAMLPHAHFWNLTSSRAPYWCAWPFSIRSTFIQFLYILVQDGMNEGKKKRRFDSSRLSGVQVPFWESTGAGRIRSLLLRVLSGQGRPTDTDSQW